ncbi:hypothetical protein ACFQ06_04890 [Tessaracoccus lubricantis]
MRSLYKILAFVIVGLVALQAAMHAWASAGVVAFLSGGGTFDMSADGPPPFPEALGILVHGLNGMYVIPVVALALLVVGFLAKFDGAVKWAAIVLALVIVQVALGFLGHGMTMMALLHGANALLLAVAAFHAARRASRVPTVVTGTRTEDLRVPA